MIIVRYLAVARMRFSFEVTTSLSHIRYIDCLLVLKANGNLKIFLGCYLPMLSKPGNNSPLYSEPANHGPVGAASAIVHQQVIFQILDHGRMFDIDVRHLINTGPYDDEVAIRIIRQP